MREYRAWVSAKIPACGIETVSHGHSVNHISNTSEKSHDSLRSGLFGMARTRGAVEKAFCCVGTAAFRLESTGDIVRLIASDEERELVAHVFCSPAL